MFELACMYVCSKLTEFLRDEGLKFCDSEALGDFFFRKFDCSTAAIEAAISIASNIEGDFDGRALERRGDV